MYAQTMRLLLLLVGFAALLPAEQDRMDLLEQVRARVLDSLRRLPKYMCTQSIYRQQIEPPRREEHASCDDDVAPRKLRVTTSDRIRLDVGVTATGEIYSWAGASRFDDRSLFGLVREGALSTGSFASFLTSIFRDDQATFSYQGETTEGGRQLSEFGFRVSQEQSHYTYLGTGARVITAYEGEFRVDSKTADLVRLVVRTSHLPPETGACQATTSLDYGRVRLQGTDFLLPTATLLLIRDTNGVEMQNRTEFSNCHEFLGESTVTFDPPPESIQSPSAPAESKALSLPAGLRFQVILAQSIDTATAAAGDAVAARLFTPIKDSSSKVLVRAGADVTARIVRIRQYFGPPVVVVLSLKLESVRVGGVSFPLSARPDDTVQPFILRPGSLHPRVEFSTLDVMTDRNAMSVELRNVQPNRPTPYGLESAWLTTGH